MVSVADVSDRLKAMQDAVPLAARTAVVAMGLEMTAETKLTLTTYSHEAGTPTPSEPGEPPAIISSDLRDSVKPMPPIGSGPLWSIVVGGTVDYARIQELGGPITAKNFPQLGNPTVGFFGREVDLPARPYLKPTAEKLIATGKLTRAAAKGWLAVMDEV
jgi:phage gpG-like protein